MSEIASGLTKLRGAIARPERPSLADALVAWLAQLGVTAAFGIVGGAVAPLSDALNRSAIRVVQTRHESGAAFAASEASLIGERPAVVFATTGPGLTNSLTGLFVARREGARVILLSGLAPANMRERFALQESGPQALLGGIYSPGPLFDYATVIEHEAQLEVAARRLIEGMRRPQGFVAHLAVPTNLQSSPMERTLRPILGEDRRPERLVDEHDVERCVRLLSSRRVMLWVGYGARGCAARVVELAERLGAPVMATPRAKGVMPEDHPLYVGVTGFSGQTGPAEAVAATKPEHILVLGSRLGEFSSGWCPSLKPSVGFIHVDIDSTVLGVAYPEVPTLGVRAELSTFLAALLERLPKLASRPAPARHRPVEREPVLARSATPVRPRVLMDAVQRIVVDGSDATVYADAGNSLAWTAHCLRFASPKRYRANMGWACMGHASAGVLGAALGRGRKTVAIVGDGAMLMHCEISTAVAHALPIVWIVLNDSRYGMVEQGMRSGGFAPVETAIPPTNFAAIARAMGAEGARVESELELDAILRRAMSASGPFVIDVVIDPEVSSPVQSRFEILRDQGAHGH